MPQKWNDSKVRTDADIRPGRDPDLRNKPSRSMDYEPGGGGARAYPGYPGPDESLRYGGVDPANTSIRNVRVGNIAGYGEKTDLGSMEIGGRTVNVPKIPAMQKFDSRPITGAGPLEQQRITQQQNNAILIGDGDYAPLRELDYESVKDLNFGRPPQKSAARKDPTFSR